MQKKFENNSFRRLLIINYYEFSLINGIPVRKVNFLMSEYIEISYAIYHLIELFELYRFHDLFLLRTSILDKKNFDIIDNIRRNPLVLASFNH